jgi:hypothetical protein
MRCADTKNCRTSKRKKRTTNERDHRTGRGKVTFGLLKNQQIAAQAKAS